MSNVSSLEKIYFACLQLGTPGERSAYLAKACAGDPALLRRLERMLEAQGSDFLERPAIVPGLVAPPAPRERVGQRIGAYRLLEPIGEGGMGTVWRAEQLEPVQRQVALKLIKAGLDSQPVIARFEAERQALALMDHPNIARVLDGGTDGAGHPYFVMDLVPGVPITTYCDEHRLAVRDRLALFVQVCAATQHAHHKGVIHRDIKPSNVLVTRSDGVPMAKVIDFGIAKAIGQQLTASPAFTLQGGLLGTLEYMSPEQAAGSAGGVDTRSDIYSLGALLYELLTGTTPLPRERVAETPYRDVLRAIADDDPPRPSTRLGAVTPASTAIAAQRSSAPARLASLLRGELDWIVMMALEKDRDRRYPTAAALAADVERHLADEPVLACPPSPLYRLHKFVRRRRGMLAAAGVLTVALTVAIGGIGWALRDREANVAEAARARAEREARVVATVDELLAGADRQMSALAWAQALATVRRADAVATGGDADPATAQRVRTTLQQVEFVERLEHIRSGLATWVADEFDSATAADDYAAAFRDRGVDADRDPEPAAIERLRAIPALALLLAGGLDDWARRHLEAGRDAAGWRRIVAVANTLDPDPTRQRIRGAGLQPTEVSTAEIRQLADTVDPRTQHPGTLVNLARGLRAAGQADAGRRLLQRTQLFHPDDFWLNFELGSLLLQARDREGALRYFTVALGLRPDSAAVYTNLGHVLRLRHELAASVTCLRRAIELDPTLPMPHLNLGRTLLDLHRADDALVALRQAVALAPRSARAWDGLASAQLAAGRLTEALDGYRRAIALDPKDAHGHAGVSDVLRAQGALHDALTAARAAVAADPGSAAAYVALGNSAGALSDSTAAEAAFRQAIALDPEDAVAHGNLGNTLLGRNTGDDPARAAEALALCRRATELDPFYARGHLALGLALIHHRQDEPAIAALRRAIELDPSLMAAHVYLGDALGRLGRDDEALVILQQATALTPPWSRTYFCLALVYDRQQRFAEAVAALRQAIALEPDAAQAHDLLARVLDKAGERDEALAEFRRAADLEPGNAFRHLALGLALHGRDQWAEAAACYRQAIAIQPGDAMANGVLGDVLHLLHRDDEAELAYRTAVAADPKFVGAHRGLAAALCSQARIADAIAALERAIEVAGEDDQVAFELALLLADGPDAQLRDPARALQFAERAADRAPRDPHIARVLGVAHYRAGNWQRSLDALQRAREFEQTRSPAHEFVAAMAHWQLGDAPAARAAYERAADAMARPTDGDADCRRLQQEAAHLLGIDGTAR